MKKIVLNTLLVASALISVGCSSVQGQSEECDCCKGKDAASGQEAQSCPAGESCTDCYHQ